jgi:hypothetical protein
LRTCWWSSRCPAEVREKLREELDLALPDDDLDPLNQTDDSAFSLFDVDGDDDG